MKKFKNILSQIFRNIFLYKKRTILSVLGILIATLIINVAVITVNYSTSDNLQDYFDYPVNTGVYFPEYMETPSFSDVDMKCLHRYSGKVDDVLVPSKKISINLYGCDESFLDYPILNENNRKLLCYTELTSGEELSSADILQGKYYIYLENEYAKYLFDGNPLGREIVIDGVSFYVNGLLKTTPSTNRYFDSLEKENEIRVVGFVPYTTLYSSFDENSINKNYVFKYKKSVNLNRIFPPNRYYSYDNAMEAINNKKSETFNKLLTIFISSILSMGTLEIIIIVFNLKERVCEIGIKRALGATKDDICFEFMLEIIIVGVMSLLLGILLTYNINMIMSILFYNSNYIFISFLSVNDIMMSSGYVLLMIGVSSLIPMIYISNLNIIDVIKGE